MPLDLQSAQRLLVYGGSFDPPHRAHVALPMRAADAVHADGVLYVPAGRPPHKSGRDLAPARHRLTMLQLALIDEPRAAISEFEVNNSDTSFTLNTLQHLRRQLGDDVELRLLMGADMAASFYTWHRPHEILALVEPLVMLRPPMDTDDFLSQMPDHLSPADRQAWRARVIALPSMAISSTAIRRELDKSAPDFKIVEQMLNPTVFKYIQDHQLYQTGR
ncbi:MAG: nicotinate (nicotinamide) nucleotide adenylyltransferase [Planctomycetaceae bacterium]|nr:nicotinate (nicotinamide) nucleotide adenylyltransferase [Planctomycetaceae bacterium]